MLSILIMLKITRGHTVGCLGILACNAAISDIITLHKKSWSNPPTPFPAISVVHNGLSWRKSALSESPFLVFIKILNTRSHNIIEGNIATVFAELLAPCVQD